MFVHGRAACTCSLYIQGNYSAGRAFKGVNPLGRNGDVRFVRRLPWIAYQDFHMLSVSLVVEAPYLVPVLPHVFPPLSQVFGIFEGAAPNPQQPQMGALAMYPFWDEKFGPSSA